MTICVALFLGSCGKAPPQPAADEPMVEADRAEAAIMEVQVEKPDLVPVGVVEEATPVAVKVAAKADPRVASRKTVMVQEAEAVYVQSERVQRSKEALTDQRVQVNDLQMEVWDYRLHRLERHAKRKGWSCDKDPGPVKAWERRFWTEWCELKPKVEAVRGPVDTRTHDWELEPDGR